MPSKPKPPLKEATAIDRRIRLRIICQKPPDREEHGAIFGLQDNSTTKEWVIHAGKTQAIVSLLRARLQPALRFHPWRALSSKP